MHHIQAKILNKLLYVDSSNYAGMRPEGIESNHYAYHLEQLLREKLVIKNERAYRLSAKGLKVIDRLSHDNMHERLQPHIITAIDLTTSDGKTLLFTRNFQPYIHLTGFPLGKTHIEETVAEAATRELYEKAGLQGIPLVHRGMVYIETKQDGLVISKVLYHVFHGNVDAPLPTKTPAHRGTCQWADYTQLDPTTLMPGFVHIKKLLAASDQLFFSEITEELNH
jgi:ADP-ribose pyrophosphatase YjhB (NUDIX family)